MLMMHADMCRIYAKCYGMIIIIIIIIFGKCMLNDVDVGRWCGPKFFDFLVVL